FTRVELDIWSIHPEHVRQFPAPRLGLQGSEILIEWGDRNVDLDVRVFLVERGNDLLHSGRLHVVPDSVIETARALGVLRNGAIVMLPRICAYSSLNPAMTSSVAGAWTSSQIPYARLAEISVSAGMARSSPPPPPPSLQALRPNPAAAATASPNVRLRMTSS